MSQIEGSKEEKSHLICLPGQQALLVVIIARCSICIPSPHVQRSSTRTRAIIGLFWMAKGNLGPLSSTEMKLSPQRPPH